MVKVLLQRLLFNLLYKKAYSRAIFTSLGIFIQEVKVAFIQFFSIRYPLSLFSVLRQIFISTVRLLAGRSARISFAYTGEDRIIDALLKPIITKPMFYVEVGCNEPIFISNTFSLYKRGWRGLCIDANGDLIKKYKRTRPRDIAVHALVSDDNQVRDYHVYVNNVLSSTESVELNPIDEPGFELVKTEKMIPKSLTQIFDENNVPTSFELLSIDVEEHDLQAIRSLDLTKYIPKLVVLESENIDPLNPSQDEIVKHMLENNYAFEGCISKNVYFLKK